MNHRRQTIALSIITILLFVAAFAANIFQFHSSPPAAQAAAQILVPSFRGTALGEEDLTAYKTYRAAAQLTAERQVALPVVEVYRVRAGDTLSGIASKRWGHASDWPALWYVNRKKVPNPYLLAVGEALKLPAVPSVTRKIRHAALSAVSGPSATPSSGGHAPPAPAPVPMGTLQAYAASVFGAQFGCAADIIMRESGWNVFATNPTSGAYGIPQALPGSKMASAGADWATDGDTQIRWMYGYVNSVYGGACAAWDHWQEAESY
jgi:hypothetical protein